MLGFYFNAAAVVDVQERSQYFALNMFEQPARYSKVAFMRRSLGIGVHGRMGFGEMSDSLKGNRRYLAVSFTGVVFSLRKWGSGRF